MSDGLFYLALKCVIEHLEANKRFHIAARSKTLRRIEKSIPLRLDYLELLCVGQEDIEKECSIQINKIWYYFTKSDIESDLERPKFRPVQCENVDFLGVNTPLVNHSIRLKNTRSNKEWEALLKLLCRLFGERGCINVDFLKFTRNEHTTIRLPRPLSFKIRKLSVEDNFRYYLGRIDSSSLPLEKVEIGVPTLSILDHQIAKTCEKLRIICEEGRTPQDLFENLDALKNQTLYLDQIHLDDVVELIQNWLTTEKDIGCNLIVICDKHRWVDRFLQPILEQLDARKVKIKESNRQGFLIPTNFPIEAIMTTFVDGFTGLKIQIQPVGYSIPFEPSSNPVVRMTCSIFDSICYCVNEFLGFFE